MTQHTHTQIYQLNRSGQYHAAMSLAEALYQRNNSINTLVDFVQLLIQHSHLDKAEEVLSNSNQSPAESLEVYHLYCDLYIYAGRTKDYNDLKLLYGESHEETGTGYISIDRTEKDLIPDRNYFVQQLGLLCERYGKSIFSGESSSNLVMELLATGHVHQALLKLRAVSDRIENKQLRYLLRAEISLVKGEYRIAEKRYRRLLGTVEDEALIWNRLGDVCLATGRTAVALDHYQKACTTTPEDIDSHLDLIRTYLVKGNTTAAKKVYLKAENLLNSYQLKMIRDLIEHSPKTRCEPRVLGLGWCEGGGSVIEVELLRTEESTALEITGHIGISMQDALHLAHRVALFTARSSFPDKPITGMQVHFPRGVIYKDGPSIGLAAYVGILGTILEKLPAKRVAYSGELTLHGQILGVGGIPGKLRTAYFAGVDRVFIPLENLPDLIQVEPHIKQALDIRLVSNVDQVVRELWPS